MDVKGVDEPPLECKRAAAFISAAVCGHTHDIIPDNAFSTKRSLSYHQMSLSLSNLIRCVLCVYLLLAFLEKPSWLDSSTTHTTPSTKPLENLPNQLPTPHTHILNVHTRGWKQRARNFLTHKHHLPTDEKIQNDTYLHPPTQKRDIWNLFIAHQAIWVHIIEVMCLGLIGFNKLCQIKAHNHILTHQIWLLSLITISIFDNILCVICVTSGMCIISYFTHILSFSFYTSRLLRPIIFGLYTTSLREIILSILRTLYKVHEIFLGIILSILVFDWWGIIFFSGTIGHQQFGSFSSGFLSLLMMLSSANFREVLLPGYAAHPAASIFFVFFYLVVEILLLGLLTAALYNAYREEHGRNLYHMMNTKNAYIDKAFNLISNEENIITFKNWNYFYIAYKQINSIPRLPFIGFNYIPSHKGSGNLFEVLQTNVGNGLTKSDFFKIHDLFTKQSVITPSTNSEFHYNQHQWIIQFISNNILDLIVFLNLLVTFSQTCGDSFKPPYEHIPILNISYGLVQSLLNLMFSAIVIYKLKNLGKDNIWHVYTINQRMDFFLVLAFIPLEFITIYTFFHPLPLLVNWPDRCLLFLKVFSGIRLLFRIRGFKKLITSLVSVLRAFYTVLGLLLLVFYVYATIGTQMFGGTIECRVTNDPWEICDSCILNFNEFLSSLITLFILMVNGWDSSLEVIFDHVSPMFCAMYFTSFYFFTDTIVLNLFVALTLEAFEQVNKSDSNKIDDVSDDIISPTIDTDKVLMKMFNSDSTTYQPSEIHSIK